MSDGNNNNTNANILLQLASFTVSSIGLITYLYKRRAKYRVGIVRPRQGIWKHDLAKKALPEDMLNKAFEKRQCHAR